MALEIYIYIISKNKSSKTEFNARNIKFIKYKIIKILYALRQISARPRQCKIYNRINQANFKLKVFFGKSVFFGIEQTLVVAVSRVGSRIPVNQFYKKNAL